MNPPRTESRPRNRLLVSLIALAIVCGVGALGYAKVVRPNIVPKNFGVVEPGQLYRSGKLTPATTRKVVEENKIKTIVDLGGFSDDPPAERVAARTATALGVERRVFRLEGDGRGNPNAYVEALRIITDPAKQPVLVHCAAGSERTSACILLYREIVQGKPIATQMHEAYEHRHNPARNPHLRPFLDEWHAKIGEAFKAGRSIDGLGKAEIAAPDVKP